MTACHPNDGVPRKIDFGSKHWNAPISSHHMKSETAVLPIELERVLNQGDVAGCVALFANATQKDRASMAKIAVPRLKKQTAGILGRLLDRFGALNEHHDRFFAPFEVSREQVVATQVAVLACAPLGQLK